MMNEEDPKYPEISQQVRNLAKSVLQQMKTTATEGTIILSDEDRMARRKTCYECIYCDLGPPERCKKCGCMLGMKINLSANSCPLGKWEK